MGVIIDNHTLIMVKKKYYFLSGGKWSKWKCLFKFECHTAQ